MKHVYVISFLETLKGIDLDRSSATLCLSCHLHNFNLSRIFTKIKKITNHSITHAVVSQKLSSSFTPFQKRNRWIVLTLASSIPNLCSLDYLHGTRSNSLPSSGNHLCSSDIKETTYIFLQYWRTVALKQTGF